MSLRSLYINLMHPWWKKIFVLNFWIVHTVHVTKWVYIIYQVLTTVFWCVVAESWRYTPQQNNVHLIVSQLSWGCAFCSQLAANCAAVICWWRQGAFKQRLWKLKAQLFYFSRSAGNIWGVTFDLPSSYFSNTPTQHPHRTSPVSHITVFNN